MMKVIGSTWTQRPRQKYPYDWLATEPGELFDAAVSRELAESFPVDSFSRAEAGSSSDKSYRNYSRNLPNASGGRDSKLPQCWRTLIEDLTSQEYRQAIASVLDQDPAPSVELRLVRHAPGDFLGPHTDRPDKVFSHIFYFNPVWREEWGGYLEILDCTAEGVAVARIAPMLGASALLARSDNSLHRVSPVADPLAPERRSLVVHGIRG